MNDPNPLISDSSPLTAEVQTAETVVGNYFISNYPPFSAWNRQALGDVERALHSSSMDQPLGLYLHIPFCRKRCKFCYFRVYTDQRAEEIESYLAALAQEIRLLSRLPCATSRPVRFVYFGGGTPSFLSVKQLQSLFTRLRESLRWDLAEEITFECEPGTLSSTKVQALRELGITRLSLGIENFNDRILEENGRAHLSAEIERSWEWIRAAQFPNVNVDLIAGMLGETWENWRTCVAKTLSLEADSVTIYQMELPYNTLFSRDLLRDGQPVPIADWNTKRAWVDYAFDQFLSRGYSISSAYTLVRDPGRVNFSYRDNLWQGADLLAGGVASFGHVFGVHYQNLTEWNDYLSSLDSGVLPLGRGLRLSQRQALIRELILQLKRGTLRPQYFQAKFGVDIRHEWQAEWHDLHRRGLLQDQEGELRLTRAGLLQVDALLPAFFEPQFRGVRYS